MTVTLSLPGGSDPMHCGQEGVASDLHCDLGGPVPGAQVDLVTFSAAPDPDLATQGLPGWIGGGHVTHAESTVQQRDPREHDICRLLGAGHCSK